MPVVSISYSGLSDWQYCPYYYKLVNIEKLRTFTKNIWTYHGTLVHHYVQAVLKEEITPENAAKEFTRKWTKLCGIFKKPLLEQLGEDKFPGHWLKPSVLAISTIKKQFKKEFGDYKVIRTEEYIRLPHAPWPQEFRGFIDIILESGDKTIIADFKTCESAFLFNKYKDKFKDYQLTLYKHFFCIKHNLDPDKVETYFIPLERTKKTKKAVHFVKISSGKVKVKNAIEWLEKALGAINRKFWIKNRMACHKYGEGKCVFYKSEHCS